ncbi:hypothetical protein R3P38DRAFT_3333012 [Favolaschia claudopus]|uniref:DUF6589 domain-containing protein n=1 Tax=Favolaschia claudopus TaxID=2862362 RepID=A0AAV9ZJC7_9AGAR
MVFFSISIRQLLHWLFTTKVPRATRAVSHFMGFFSTQDSLEDQFGPAMVFALWRDAARYPRAQKYLREMTIPCAHELVLEDSDRIITSPILQIRLKTLTIQQLRDVLHPTKLVEIIQRLAPFTWNLLHTFSASPNASRKRRKSDKGEEMVTEEEDWIDDPNDDSNLESGEADPGDFAGHGWRKDYPGFARNPVFAILMTITMLAFVRNRATNLLPLILGLFFKISGTSSRVILMLSNAGICVSGRTVERLKVRITEDAIQLAVNLIGSGQVYFTIFDNINIFLRKAQQRLSNTNNMINATNAAVVGVEGVDPLTADDLAEQLALRGRRANATAADIVPSPADDEIVGRTFTALIAERIVSFTPGNSKWSERKDIVAGVADMMPKDRPFGVFDVNEGSKKGVVEFLQQAQERSTLSQTVWSSIPRRDWLFSNNLRAGRRDRTEDINSMERLEYVQELSAPFHFALQASHMLMRVHYGHAVEDPGSLAAHKGLLGRKWDVSKPNYAAAKSLIRHSLIARILHCVMVINGFTLHSQLSQWTPTLADIQTIALTISTTFATATAAQAAQAAAGMIGWHIPSISFGMPFSFPCSKRRTGSLHCGVGQHNYARKCAEVLVRWKYELTDKTRRTLERSWFINRWGILGRAIASDLYLEQLNFWVKRVFIASGSGVTREYIIRKGSACVETFRDLTHMVANFFGDADRSRRSKEIKFTQDLEALVTEMQRRNFHVVSKDGHFVPAPPKKARGTTTQNVKAPEPPRSAIVDVFVKGAEEWNGKFKDFIKSTTFDPALNGYPPDTQPSAGPRDTTLDTNTVFDSLTHNPLSIEGYIDIHGSNNVADISGALGGGGDFDGVE